MLGGILSGSAGLLGGITNGILGGLNYSQNSEIAKKNLAFQKDVFNYQKQLQREIFQREDNSTRRKAADILAAGGNPALAWETGQAAGVGQSVPVSAPQEQMVDMSQIMKSSLASITGGLDQFFKFRQSDAVIKNLEASNASIYTNIAKSEAETVTEVIRQKQLQLQMAKTEEERRKIQKEIEVLSHNLDFSINHELRTTDNLNTLYNTTKSIAEDISNLIPDNIENLNASDVGKLLLDVGLLALPGFGLVKTAKLGYKGIKGALKYLKGNKGIPTVQDFVKTYRKLTGSSPSGYEINQFVKGNKQYVNSKRR